MIDPQRPWSRALGTETVVVATCATRAGDRAARPACAAGAASLDILLAMLLATDPSAKSCANLKHAESCAAVSAGMTSHISRTGYTGEPMAFELFVHPDDLGALARAVQAGEPFGLRPSGWRHATACASRPGCRSTGTSWPARWISTRPMPALRLMSSCTSPSSSASGVLDTSRKAASARLVRFRLDEEHAPLPGQGDVIVNRKGRVVGPVTSCSIDTDGRLTGLAFVEEPTSRARHALGVYRLGGRNWESRPLDDLKPGDRLQLPEDITVIERFLNKR